MPDESAIPTSSPVTSLPGVGPRKAEQLERLKIQTIEDLLLHRPRRYEDRSRCLDIIQAEDGAPAVFRGKIEKIQSKRFRGRRGGVVEITVQDATGTLMCRWWNQPYVSRNFQTGSEVLVFGRPILNKTTTIDHPDVETVDLSTNGEDIHVNRIVPVYPLTQGVQQRWLRQCVWDALIDSEDAGVTRAGTIPTDPTLTKRQALWRLHFPDALQDVDVATQYFAREELLEFQLKLQRRRLHFCQRAKAPACNNSNRLISPFLKTLPFELTGAQQRVLKEIRDDLNRPFPMRRLLQGDVGCGKTVVAAASILMMLESGFDAALLAPTALLARQHYETLSQWFTPIGIPTRLHISDEKHDASESPALTIGTHALLEDSYQPSNLALIVIDEQHRFGVSQRDRILRKGDYPHLLAMTATPIPRSLGLTVYGDLEQSILDESPAERGTIHTHVRRGDRLDRIWAFIREQITEGRQAYIVYPRIEVNPSDEVKSIHSELDRVRQHLPNLSVAAVHGQLDRDEAQSIMRQFRDGKIQALVATTVIEVGMDVPNASVMLIENAERFGLAQLHQMRGRIGRGSADSHCILVAHSDHAEAWERLKILENNRDGFAIAEHDLTQRGPGEFLGKQQSGLPRFRFADLFRDRQLVREIRQKVRGHLGLDELMSPPTRHRE